MLSLLRRDRRYPGLRFAIQLIVCVGMSLPLLEGAEPSRRSFALAAGDAEATLEAFSEQAGLQIVYPFGDVRGVSTNAVHGDFAVREALERLVAGTGLQAMQDERTGAFVIKRGRAVAPAATPPAPSNSTTDPQTSMKTRNRLALFGAWLGLVLQPALAADSPGGTGTIEGRVLNERTGDYLEKARVSIEGTSLEAFTDATGWFRLSAVPAGSATVKVTFTGLTPLTSSVTMNAGATVQRDFSFNAGDGRIVRLGEFVVGASREMDGAAIAINEQRYAPNIQHVVSAGEFGISADGSLGEFLKFLPGIAIDYTEGTASTITLDGVGANYVPITVGGFELASVLATSTSRATELLQVSIHNAARIEVTHSPTPESPGGALAGSVNVVPRGAFERSRPLFTGSTYLMMRDNYLTFDKTRGPGKYANYKIQPGFDFSYIVPVNKRFGFTLSGSYSNQFIPQDTLVNTWRGASAATTGLTAATAATQYPDTTPDRPYMSALQVTSNTKMDGRTSFGATVDYRLTPHDTLSFSYQYGSYERELSSKRIIFAMNRIAAGNFSPTAVHSEPGRAELTNRTGWGWRYGQTHAPSLVYRRTGPLWRSEAGIGYSHATSLVHDFRRGFFDEVVSRRTNVTIAFDDIFYLGPRGITVTDGTTGAPVDPYSLSTYQLINVVPNEREALSVKRSVYANTSRTFNFRGASLTLKGGVDVRQSIRDIDNGFTGATYNYIGPAGAPPLLRDEGLSERMMPYGLGRLEAMSSVKAHEFYHANRAFFGPQANAEYRGQVNLSKYAEETISSVFLRGDLALLERRLKLVGGLRVEQTNIKAQGPETDPTGNYQRDAAGNVRLGADGRPLRIATDALEISKLTFIERGAKAEKEYLRLFPSVNASYNITEKLVARGAFSTSIGRPDFNQYAGGITLPDVDDPAASNQRITVGNAGIKPWSAKSTKLRLEYYFEGVGQVAVGVFRRDFENFFANIIVPATPEFLALYDLDPAIYGDYDVSTQHNLTSRARITGFEAEYKQVLTFLPHWARGVQVFANITSLRTIGASSSSFNGFQPRTYNWGVTLSRPKFIVRANWNYHGLKRQEPISGRGIEPGTFRWKLKKLSMDLQGEYYFWKRLAVFANLRNVGNATDDTERAGPSTPPHAQFNTREDYGASWTIGIKGSF